MNHRPVAFVLVSLAAVLCAGVIASHASFAESLEGIASAAGATSKANAAPVVASRS